MMESNEKKKKLERVLLTDDCTKLLNSWLNELKEENYGIKIKKKDLIEWLVLSHGPMLSKAEKKSIQDRYFDDEQLAMWALKQLKFAKKKGEALTLGQLLAGRKQKAPMKRKEKANPEQGVRNDQ